MHLQQIYDLGVEMGIKADPRGEDLVKRLLAKTRKEYEELSEKKKKYFDKESLTNPYADSRLYIGDPQKEIKKIIVGIDAESAEVLLVDRLNQKGEAIDAIITHHPHGAGSAGLYEVHDLLTDAFAKAGVPENISDALISERSGEIMRRLRGPNGFQTIDTARLLNIPFLSMHTIWDNITYDFLTSYIAKKTYDSLGELLEYIRDIPEFSESIDTKIAPQIFVGSEKSRVGKILVECTGGTNTTKAVYEELSKAGVGTIVQMHIPEDHIKELKRLHINGIDIGHIAADSIGANFFLDALEAKGIAVIPFGGLVRVKRSKNK